MKKAKIIGLTGQSGSGKSTASEYLKNIGITVIDADKLVKEIYEDDSICLKAVCAVFGNDLIKENSLDRKLLAQRAFSSKENTKLLSNIVHPFVTAKFLTELKKTNADVVVYDAPQLFESDFDAVCDCIISIIADKAIRLERICKRDNISVELALMRMNAQLDEKFFIEKSDYVIENNLTEKELVNQLQKVLAEIGVK